jgi:hypothetical protein
LNRDIDIERKTSSADNPSLFLFSAIHHSL